MTIEKDKEKVFTLRIKQSLFDAIKQDAEKNKRSITKHIEFILESNINK